jgi:ribosomal protein L37E
MTSDNILEAQMDDRRLNEKERNGFPVCKKCGGQVLPRNDNKCIQCGYDQKDPSRLPPQRRHLSDRLSGVL